jgi:LAS superfamily LD-carboxypeptidase LdcB
MQFFYIENMPVFGGLYQVMEVTHNLTPNNFETKFKGMKMRYSGGFGGIPPVTLETLKSLSEKIKVTSVQPVNYTTNNVPDYSDVKEIGNNPPVESSDSFDTKSVTALKQLYRNGELPENALIESSVMRALYIGKDKRDIKYKLFKDASSSLNAFINYFNKSKFQGKQPLSITDGYRDLQEQIILRDRLGTQAAKPGTSNHGWGVAVDFWWGVPTNFRKNDELRKIAFNHPMYKWFFDNAWRFGWYNPAGLRDNSGLDEWWHWEYFGTQGAPGSLPSIYAQNFDFSKFPQQIKSNGGFFKV